MDSDDKEKEDKDEDDLKPKEEEESGEKDSIGDGREDGSRKKMVHNVMFFLPSQAITYSSNRSQGPNPARNPGSPKQTSTSRSLKHLVNFSKSASLSLKVQILKGNDVPLLVSHYYFFRLLLPCALNRDSVVDCLVNSPMKPCFAAYLCILF